VKASAWRRGLMENIGGRSWLVAQLPWCSTRLFRAGFRISHKLKSSETMPDLILVVDSAPRRTVQWGRR
jgi:hypothetical protein